MISTSSQMKESRPRCWVVLVGAGGGKHLPDSLARPWTASERFSGKITSGKPRGKTDGKPNLGMKFLHGSLEVHQFGMKLWEPRSCSTYSVRSHCCERCFFFSMEDSTCGPERSLLSYISAELGLYYLLRSPIDSSK